ncbi:hypothetical protein ACFLSJ_08530 [Verrucomicrobiota bacterium]
MKAKVYGGYGDAPKSTITLSKTVRDAIAREHGVEVRPGYAAQVEGAAHHCPRNLIVQIMRKEDRLIRKKGVCRIGPVARRRLGINIGDPADVRALKHETWYHGTKAPNPVATLVKGEWIVGGSGQGVWMSDLMTMAQGYVGTALMTMEVAWGEQLNWPLPAHMATQFQRWCKEKNVDASAVTAANWRTDPNLLRWARLYGHYFVPFGNARIFPGVTGESFKGNRVRIVKMVGPDGSVLYTRNEST